MQKEKGLQFQRMVVLQPDEIDRYLYEILPVFPTFEMREKIQHVLESMPEITKA